MNETIQMIIAITGCAIALSTEARNWYKEVNCTKRKKRKK